MQLYREETGTGLIHLAMSKDSTCTTQLYTAGQGFETYKLSLQPTLPWPQIVTKTVCRLETDLLFKPTLYNCTSSP